MTRSYEKYKSIENYGAIDSIPSEWDLLPNIAIFDERISKGHLDEELISVTIGRGIIRQSEIGNKKDNSNEDKSNYKLVKVGDIAYNKMRMWQGSVGYSQYRGIVSPAYVVLKPKLEINSQYYHYLFRTQYYNNYAKRFSYGLCDDQLNLRYSDFKRMYSIVPPIETQNKIVEYLNEKTKKINEFIFKKEKMIKLLKEEKKATISYYMKQGIELNSKKKHSGVEWIGDIPEKWECIKLKYLLREKLKYGANESAEFEDREQPRYIRITDFGDDGFLKEDTFKSLHMSKAKDYLLKEGDILFARSGATVGKTFQYKNYDGDACFAGYLIKASVNTNIIKSDFLYLFTKSNIYDSWKNSIFNKATIENIGADKYSVLEIPLPSLNEQEEIVKKINSKNKKIDEIIKKLSRTIELVNLHRETLIFNVVTGQIKIN